MFSYHASCDLWPKFLDYWVCEELSNHGGIVVSEDISEDTNSTFTQCLTHWLACIVDALGWIEQKCTCPYFKVGRVIEPDKIVLHKFFDLFEESFVTPVVDTLG